MKKVDDLEIWLKEERLPQVIMLHHILLSTDADMGSQGWQPSNRDRFGLSMAAFNKSVFAVEFKIPNSPYKGAELTTDETIKTIKSEEA